MADVIGEHTKGELTIAIESASWSIGNPELVEYRERWYCSLTWRRCPNVVPGAHFAVGRDDKVAINNLTRTGCGSTSHPMGRALGGLTQAIRWVGLGSLGWVLG